MARLFPFLREACARYCQGHIVRMVCVSVLLGVPVGLAAFGFSWALHQSDANLLARVGHYRLPTPDGEKAITVAETKPPNRLWLLLLPAAGGLAAGWLVQKFAPEAEGLGTNKVIDAFHHHEGQIRGRVFWVKMLASAFTIGSGGAAGREGPMAQIGGALASSLARRFRMSVYERRLVLIAAAGAGVGAVFRAPLGGALFATEILYRDADFEFEGLLPSFVTSAVAYSVYCPLAGHGWGPLFSVGALRFHEPDLLLLYALLAVVVFAIGRLYIGVFYAVRDRVFRPLPVPEMVKPALGGLALGATALLFAGLTGAHQMGAIYGTGFGWLQQALDGRLTIGFMLLLMVFKIVGVSLTVGSAGSGGVYGPSIVVGGMAGGVFGALAGRWLPGLVGLQGVGAFAMVGMAGLFAGIANTPLTALILIAEMTGGYAMIVPLMLAAVLCYSLAYRGRSIYEPQVESRRESPVHAEAGVQSEAD